ncbi:MAG: hypothetical protein JJU16_08960 [Alkalibacterium sp.]|nr:hypothetical protein [Alkalibacterium sp.]
MNLSNEDILEEISVYLHGYLKEGKISIQPFLKDIHVNINSIQDLLKIRFLIHPETISFVSLLPNRLKRFKTTTIAHKEITHSDIRGRILWQETVLERFKMGNDSSVYVTAEQNRSYDTDENLVLKEALTILHRLIYVDKLLEPFRKTTWAFEWTSLSGNLERALFKNSYIQRVSTIQTTRKQRLRAAQHRLPIYREAAALLKNYYRFIRGDYTQEELKEVLKATFILTENEDVLMELYWAIQLIKERTTDATFFLLKEGETKVAQWLDGDYEYTVSHNSTGSSDLNFLISYDELGDIDHPVITQMIEAKKWAETYSNLIFGSIYTRGLWSGRPDILIEVRHIQNGELKELVIGEVKNTDRVSYAKEGLWELSEYLHLIRTKNYNYINNEFPIRGVLCLGNVPVKETSFKQLEIRTLANQIKD